MSNLKPHPDPEIKEFEQALLRSIEQAKQGKFARISTPVEIHRRKRGQQRGSIKVPQKTQITVSDD